MAQFKTVILLTASGTVRVTNPQFDASLFKSELALQDADLNALLATPLGKQPKKKAAKAAEPAAAAEASASK